MTGAATCTRHDWPAPDGETFPYSLWHATLPAGQHPRAVVIAVHGLSGAALDFEPLALHLTPHGIVTYAPELRGQGSDPKPDRRGDLAQLEDWYRDLRAFFSLVRSRHPDAQIYYYGESMGGALLTRFVAQAAEPDLPAGLILASPVVILPGKQPLWKMLLFRFFLLVHPTYRLDVGRSTRRDRDNPAKWVTRDEAHRRWFETAPHRVTRFTVRFFKCLFELINGCLEAAPRVKVPTLVIYAANDVFIRPARVEKFFAQLGSREKELHFFPTSYHLLLHDHDKAQVLDRIESWLLRRIDVSDRRTTAEARFQI